MTDEPTGEALARILAGAALVRELNAEETAEVKAALDQAIARVDDALRIVLVMLEEIQARQQKRIADDEKAKSEKPEGQDSPA
jgi:hypothetical protein